MDEKLKEAKTAFTRYEEIKHAIAELEVEMESLKPIILETIPEGKKVKGDAGVFSRGTRTTYVYSAECESKMEQVKNLQKEEVAKGIAAPKITEYLMYSPNKN